MTSSEHDEAQDTGQALKLASTAFEKLEHWITVGIGAVLVCTTVLLLGGAIAQLWTNFKQWPDTGGIFLVVDQLLFVFMLVEILHTVRAAIRSKELQVEPFLIVGLIATVRRMLIVTVETSSSTPKSGPDESFAHAMVELGVLAGLIIVLIVSIYLSRHSQRFTTRSS